MCRPCLYTRLDNEYIGVGTLASWGGVVMAWIESHQELREHPKTRKASRMLDVSVPTLIGHLHLLWWWASDYAEDGDLSGYENYEIADAAMWGGDPHQFVEVLCTCGKAGAAGFLETVGDDESITLHLHDWGEYAGKIIDKRKADARRKRDARLGLPSLLDTDVRRTSTGHPTDGAGTLPNHTLPNQTKPVSSVEPAPDQATDNFTTWFDEVCSLYPKKTLRQSAMKAARRIAVRDWDAVVASVKNYVQSTKVIEGFIKDLPGYLKDEFWKDYVDGPIIEVRGKSNGQSRRDQQIEDAALGAFGATLDEVFGGATGRAPADNQASNVRQLPGGRKAG